MEKEECVACGKKVSKILVEENTNLKKCKGCIEDAVSDAYIALLTENVKGLKRHRHLQSSWGESHSVVQ